MILSALLLAGCLLWALGELILLVSGQITVLGGTIATLGLMSVSAGIFALKDLPGMQKPGRVGIVLTAFGALSFAMVMIIILTSGVLGAMAQGAVRHADMVFTPFYLLALAFLVSGLVALAIHFRSRPDGRLWAALASGLAIVHLARLFGADAAALHEVAGFALAFYLGALGVKTLRR